MADKTCLDQLFELAPGLHEILVNVGLRVRVVEIHVATGRMKIREGPVDEIEVEIVELEVLE